MNTPAYRFVILIIPPGCGSGHEDRPEDIIRNISEKMGVTSRFFANFGLDLSNAFSQGYDDVTIPVNCETNADLARITYAIRQAVEVSLDAETLAYLKDSFYHVVVAFGMKDDPSSEDCDADHLGYDLRFRSPTFLTKWVEN